MIWPRAIGVYDGTKVIYPELDASLRTDESFRTTDQPQHHNAESPLLRLNLGMVTQFSLDYLHLVCLGVGKRLLFIFCRSKIPYRESQNHLDLLSAKMVSFRKHFPSEFHR